MVKSSQIIYSSFLARNLKSTLANFQYNLLLLSRVVTMLYNGIPELIPTEILCLFFFNQLFSKKGVRGSNP